MSAGRREKAKAQREARTHADIAAPGNDEFGEHSGPTSSDRVQSPPLGKPSIPVNMRIHLSS